MRPATESEIQRWDELVAANPDGGNPLQGLAFARTKSVFGWQPHHLVDDELRLAVLVLVRLTICGPVAYVPAGPGIVTLDEVPPVLAGLKRSLRPSLVKIEPPLPDTGEASQSLRQAGLLKVADVQLNRATMMVDLQPDEEALMASFKQKTRYNIRLAGRNGVVVAPEELSPTNIDLMYGLMAATKDRAGFFLRPKAYFARFWQEHVRQGSGQLFLARHNEQVIAGAFVCFVGQTALYKDGGSRRDGQNVQAPYLLQWEIMRWLKAQGCKRYDLHGVPPAGAAANHKLASLVQFKSGFGQTVQTVGAWDMPLSSLRYKLWRQAGERLTLGLLRRLKQDLFY